MVRLVAGPPPPVSPCGLYHQSWEQRISTIGSMQGIIKETPGRVIMEGMLWRDGLRPNYLVNFNSSQCQNDLHCPKSSAGGGLSAEERPAPAPLPQGKSEHVCPLESIMCFLIEVLVDNWKWRNCIEGKKFLLLFLLLLLCTFSYPPTSDCPCLPCDIAAHPRP